MGTTGNRPGSASLSSRILTKREIVFIFTLFMTLYYSMFMVGSGVTLHNDDRIPNSSNDSLVAFYIISGSVMFIASLLELIYEMCYGSTKTDPKYWLYWISIVVIFGMFLLNAVVIILVTMKVGGSSSSTGDIGGRLDDYSSWLRKTYANDGHRWNLIKDSLIRQNVCEDITRTVYGTIPSKDELSVMTSTFTSIQTGCCMPPIECNFHYVSPTVWNKPPTPPSSSLENSDCKAWDSNSSTLCFNCDLCKAALLHNIKVTWKQLAHENTVLLLVLFLLYCVGIVCYIRSSPNGYFNLQN